MSSGPGEVLAVILMVLVFIGILEMLLIFFRHMTKTLWPLFPLGCLLMLFLGAVPSALSGSEDLLKVSYSVLAVVLAVWTILRAGNILSRRRR